MRTRQQGLAFERQCSTQPARLYVTNASHLKEAAGNNAPPQPVASVERAARLKNSHNAKEIKSEQPQGGVDAAIAGMGLAIVPDIIARPALDRGDLVLATERQFETGDHYAMIMPVSGMSQTARLFIDWVQTGIAGCPKADGAQ